MEERLAGAAPSADWVMNVLDAAPAAIVTIDSSGRVVQFNRAAERAFERERAETIGGPFADLVVPPASLVDGWAGLAGVQGDERTEVPGARLELRGLRRRGEEFPVEVITTRTGESPPVWTCFISDLSELGDTWPAARPQALLARAEQLALLGTWELDLRSLDAVWSEGLYRIHRLEPEAFQPSVERVLDLIHRDDVERASTILATVVETPDRIPEEGVTVEYRVMCGDGAVRTLRARGRVERDAGGRPARWVGVAQDVTGERQARIDDAGAGKLSGTRKRILSKRELEVLDLAAEGNTGPQIAGRLSLSPATVKTHFENIYEKLGVSDRAAAVARGLRTGLIR